jgi:hypothetical protein
MRQDKLAGDETFGRLADAERRVPRSAWIEWK